MVNLVNVDILHAIRRKVKTCLIHLNWTMDIGSVDQSPQQWTDSSATSVENTLQRKQTCTSTQINVMTPEHSYVPSAAKTLLERERCQITLESTTLLLENSKNFSNP